jgi:hypothetical protein
MKEIPMGMLKGVLNLVIMLVNSVIWTLWYALVSASILLFLILIVGAIGMIALIFKEGFTFEKLGGIVLVVLAISLVRPVVVWLTLVNRPEFDLL